MKKYYPFKEYYMFRVNENLYLFHLKNHQLYIVDEDTNDSWFTKIDEKYKLSKMNPSKNLGSFRATGSVLMFILILPISMLISTFYPLDENFLSGTLVIYFFITFIMYIFWTMLTNKSSLHAFNLATKNNSIYRFPQSEINSLYKEFKIRAKKRILAQIVTIVISFAGYMLSLFSYHIGDTDGAFYIFIFLMIISPFFLGLALSIDIIKEFKVKKFLKCNFTT